MKQLRKFLMPSSVFRKRGMGILRSLSSMKGCLPAQPDIPVLQSEFECFLLDRNQLKYVWMATVNICPERPI